MPSVPYVGMLEVENFVHKSVSCRLVKTFTITPKAFNKLYHCLLVHSTYAKVVPMRDDYSMRLLWRNFPVVTPPACVSVCLSVGLSVGTKNASSPGPGRSISAKYIQTVQNVEKLPCLCF